MGFSPADFQKGTGQGQLAADQVSLYLQGEEDHLLDNILQAFQISLEDTLLAKKGGDEGIASRFGEAIDRVIAQLDQLSESEGSKAAREELDIVVAHVNAAFRHYEEILEGCATQLFTELERMRVDQVGEDTISGAGIVKDKVVGQISDCMLQIRRLNKKLSQYQRRFAKWKGVVNWVQGFFKPIIDKGITVKLRKVRVMVNDGFQQLKVRHIEYQQLDQWVQQRRARLEKFPVFQTLPTDSQQKFGEIYRLLKMQNHSRKTSDLIVKELSRLLREAITVEEAVSIFNAYEKCLSGCFFQLRREIPQRLKDTLTLPDIKVEVSQKIYSYRAEVHVLASTVFRYREFILNTHPDPYVRARLGFAESTVGPEPETTKILVRLGHRVETLEKRFRKLDGAIAAYDPTAEPDLELGYFDRLLDDVDTGLLEASRPMEAVDRMQELLRGLETVKELYHFDRYRVMGVEKVLRLILRYDRFHVFPKHRGIVPFFETHLQVRGSLINELQQERVDRLREIRREILGGKERISDLREEWLRKADTILNSLEEFIAEKREQESVTFDELTGEVMQRRYEVLDFLYVYRCFLATLKELGEPIPYKLERLVERVSSIESDFTTLVSLLGRSKGPMTLQEIRAIENL